MKKEAVPDVIAWKRGFEDLEKMRLERIRKSDILIDGPILQGALESARFLGVKKPLSGLVELSRILSKIKR